MTTVIRRRAQVSQLETATPLVASVIARETLDEASRWLGEPLPSRYAAGLAHRARRFFVHSPRHRHRWISSPEAGREWLYAFMRHWLAARLYAERPVLYARLPERYRTGQPLPERPAARDEKSALLSNDARLLLTF